MSGLTDQQYLIQRARELKIKDPYQAKVNNNFLRFLRAFVRY